MGLASLLLGGSSNESSNVDNELDTLFKSQPAPLPKPVPSQTIPKSDPKPKEDTPVNRKRKEPPVNKKSPSTVVKRQKPDVTGRKSSKSHSPAKTAKSTSKTRKEVDLSSGNDTEDSEENDPALEDNYLNRTHASKKGPAPEESGDDSEPEEIVKKGESSEEEDEDYDLNAPPPKHETLTESQTRTKKKVKKSKYVPPNESPAQRDARTIFIGNIPIEVVKSKSTQKQLKRDILNLVPQAKIESIRFRSVAFSAPTASLDEKAKKLPNEPTLSTKEQRQKERADEWRKSGGEPKKGDEGKRKRPDGDASESDNQPHKASPAILTPAQRKRVAFYKHKFHKEIDSSNAYLVFAHLPPKDSTAEDTSALYPAEVARLAVEKGNGITFMSRTLRIDRVGQWKAGLPDSERDHVSLETLVDPHCTLFVGNLDFAAKDEDLRAFFDSLVTKEKGEELSLSTEDQPATGESKDEVVPLKTKSWVKNVRIIRDRDTQLGKGFAYVRFIDRECVDEVLALESGSVKFAKRKLRLQRCKGVPGATPKSAPVAKPSMGKSPQSKMKQQKPASKHPVKPRTSSVSIPKGDPNLGAKLVSLSKEERKVVKAADSSRVERRLAKKQVKSLLKNGKSGDEKLENKRHRQRKPPAETKKVQSIGSKKGRVRSEHSVSKRNTKK